MFKEDAGKKVRASLGIEVTSRLTGGAMSLPWRLWPKSFQRTMNPC